MSWPRCAARLWMKCSRRLDDEPDEESQLTAILFCGQVECLLWRLPIYIQNAGMWIANPLAVPIVSAIEIYKKAGAEVVEVTLPHTEYAVGVYYIVATAEASSNLARFDGVKYGERVDEGTGLLDMYKATRDKGFGVEVKRRIMLGTYALSSGYYDAYYMKASQVRTLIRRDFDDAFKDCDIILTPTTPTAAFKKGEKTDDPLTMYLSDIFTISCNLAGIPGISVPCGMTSDGLPIGLQLLAPSMEEARLFRAAYGFEAATDWNERRPSL